jgi:hypothetical protein
LQLRQGSRTEHYVWRGLNYHKMWSLQMKAIRLYRNPDCAKCARLARIHHRFDWLNRFEDTTDVPATGALALGEIVVQDLASGQLFKGVECFSLLCRHIPAYWFNLLLLYLPPYRRYIDREVRGCSGVSCALSEPSREGGDHAGPATR